MELSTSVETANSDSAVYNGFLSTFLRPTSRKIYKMV